MQTKFKVSSPLLRRSSEAIRVYPVDGNPVSLSEYYGEPVPYRDAIMRAFHRLQKVGEFDGQALSDVLLQILTLPDPADPCASDTVSLQPGPKPPKRSAAHPRGYRGTKYRPPKLKDQVVGNLYAAMDNRKLCHHLLALNWMFLASAEREINAILGTNFSWREVWLTPPSDVFLAAWHPMIYSKYAGDVGGVFCENFKNELLWWCDTVDPDRMLLLDQLCRDNTLGWCEPVAHLLKKNRSISGNRVVDWCSAIGYLPVAEYQLFMRVLNRFESIPPVAEPRLLERLTRLQADVLEASVQNVLDFLSSGCDQDYLCLGLDIHLEFSPWRTFYGAYSEAPISDTWVTLFKLEYDQSDAGFILPGLWKLCGSTLKLDAYLEALLQSDWPNTVVEAALVFLIQFAAYREAPFAKAWYVKSAIHLEQLVQMLGTMELEYIQGTIADLNVLFSDDKSLGEILASWNMTLAVVQRYRKAPFSPNLLLGRVLWNLARVKNCPEISDTTLITFSKLCKRHDDTNLFAWGMGALADTWPELVAVSINRYTRRLYSCAHNLGCLQWETQRQVVNEWIRIKRPCFKSESASLKEVADELKHLLPETHSAFLPKAVKAYLTGDRILSDAQLQRHYERITDDWTIVLLSSLTEFIHAHLGRSITRCLASHKDFLFALKLLPESDGNRTAFRRFLKAYSQGNSDYLWLHPLSQRWIANYPDLDVERWRIGVVISESIQLDKEHSVEITLTTEQNPLEVLKMGQYVGSCLSLGGICSYSASAVMLDVNKQVVFARDEKGRVLARQLIALTSECKLVAYDVYPSVSEPLKKLFTEYLLSLSRALTLEITFDTDASVDLILASEWWDDGVIDKSCLLTPESV
ncbi:MAG: hypothetical protein MI864_17980 [Pseudomonadales bacterium]|nr:hypothetical protein [Pseudomonadales bacterium]